MGSGLAGGGGGDRVVCNAYAYYVSTSVLCGRDDMREMGSPEKYSDLGAGMVVHILRRLMLPKTDIYRREDSTHCIVIPIDITVQPQIQ
jgi:hypothetical protein